MKIGKLRKWGVKKTSFAPTMELWHCQKSSGACKIGLKVNVVLLDKTSSFQAL
jgi:hypothetical protein